MTPAAPPTTCCWPAGSASPNGSSSGSPTSAATSSGNRSECSRPPSNAPDSEMVADGLAAPVAGVKRILFVDDDEFLLEGLRDALRPYRHQWAMRLVASGETALTTLATQPHDVVVCDLRMPGLDGATLLELVQERWPSTVRIVLSGHADIHAVSRAA